MGREIRRVPADWEHPKDHFTKRFKPLLGGCFDEESADWYAQAVQWMKGEHPNQLEEAEESKSWIYLKNPELRPSIHKWYHEYGGDPPSERHNYMEHYVGGRECTHWQLYEDVSEGTPVSPIFASREDLVEWMKGPGDFADWAVEMVENCGSCCSAISIQ